MRTGDNEKRGRKSSFALLGSPSHLLASYVLELANVLLLGEDGGCWYCNRVYTKTRLFFFPSPVFSFILPLPDSPV